MEEKRNVGERTGLRVVRILTNILTLTGSAAALGIATGASKAGIVGVCLYMAVLALTADWMQHKIRSFRVYTILCFTLVVLIAALGRLVMPLVWIPVGVLGLIEVWSMYESRISERPAFVPHPMGLTVPILIWMVGTFGEIAALRALAFVMETGLVLLFLAWHNQKSLERTYVAASERTRVPYGKIQRLNTGLLILYLAAALVLCLVLTAVCSDSEAVFLIPYAALMLVGVIVGALIWLITLAANFLSGGQMGTAGVAPRPFDLEGAEALFPWMHTFWIIVDTIFIVAGSLLILYMLYWSIYNLYYSFLAVDPETGDTRKRQNTKETRRSKRPAASRFPILAGLGPAAGIRRAYISLIRMYPSGTELPDTYTPSQIEYAVAGDAALEEEWKEIHALYEKARFAPALTDRHDLLRMRELVRRRREGELRRQEMEKRKISEIQ
jgi:hypothetical protein